MSHIKNSKNIKGETMSASNRGTARRRIALFTSGSLAAATIMAVAGGVALTPDLAHAANECVPIGVDPSVNGSASDTYTCAGASTYTVSGITYDSAGALTVNSTGAMNVGTVGVNLDGNGADPVTFTATGVITGTAGPVLDVSTGSGAINITTAGITGTNANVTYGILAESTGGGSVTINNPTGAINVSTFSASSQESAIKAVSTGGNGNVSVTSGGAITGKVRGIEAQASGTGSLTITTSAAVGFGFSFGASSAVAAIDATTGTGLLTVNIATGSGDIGGSTSATAILTDAGGDAVINIASGRTISSGFGGATVPLLDLTAAGTTTVTNAGSINAGVGTAIRAAGGAFVLNNNGALAGGLDFSGLSGASTVNNNAGATWTIGTASTHLVNDFGDGEGLLSNAGTITIGASATGGTFGTVDESVTFEGLETFENAGTIIFGSTRNRAGHVLAAPGAAFTGSGSSLLMMEAMLYGAGQESCLAITVADCLDLTGGATSGVTAIRLTALPDPVSEAEPVTTAINPGIVLVDVAGGAGQAGDFVLDPASTNYAADPVYGAVITTGGMFDYTLLYDPDTQQHVLASAPQGEAIGYVSFIQQSLSTWHITTDAVAGRQADLRDGARGGGWLRVVGDHTSRDAAPTATVRGNAFAFDQGYSVNTGSVVGGYDVASGGDYVIGLTGGFVYSTTEFDGSNTSDKTLGGAAGLYGGWWNDSGLSLDGALNANFLKLEHEVPGFENSSSNVLAIGARAELGWRTTLSESVYVQPLATVAYVRAEIADLALRDYDLTFEDAESLRGALGVRVGGDAAMGGGRLGYWLTGRAWQEAAGDGRVLFAAGAGSVAVEDDLSGQFQELGVGVNFSDEAGSLSAFVSGGAKFADDIDSYSISLGAHLRW